MADHPGGLAVLGIGNLRAPRVDNTTLRAGMSLDVEVVGSLALVANGSGGLKVLDVSTPAAPSEIGSLDGPVIIDARSVGARDSFAYLGWLPNPYFRSMDISDPAAPCSAGTSATFDYPSDMVLRDSLAYCAERLRFQVINVARPRSPVLVGSCNIQDGVWGLAVAETLAYVAGTSLQIVSIANPTNPRLVYTGGHPSIGVAVQDTFAYIPSFDTLFVYSMAVPTQPRVLSRTPSVRTWDVELGDSLLFIGTGVGVQVYTVGDPAQPRLVGAASAPYGDPRLCYAGGRLYGADWDAGIVIYETTQVGIAERREGRTQEFRVWPNVTRGKVWVQTGARTAAGVSVWDVSGRVVLARPLDRLTTGPLSLDLSHLSPGIYFLRMQTENYRSQQKVVLAR